MVSTSQTGYILEIGASGGLKIGFSGATVETILLYGSTAWTLTQSLDKKLDGAYTKMLRMVKNVTW